MTNKYLLSVYNNIKEKDKNEPEFLQAVYEVLTSIEPYVNEHHTVYNDHVVKQNVYQNVAATENYCDYTEQTVYNNGCNNNYGGNWF